MFPIIHASNCGAVFIEANQFEINRMINNHDENLSNRLLYQSLLLKYFLITHIKTNLLLINWQSSPLLSYQ